MLNEDFEKIKSIIKKEITPIFESVEILKIDVNNLKNSFTFIEDINNNIQHLTRVENDFSNKEIENHTEKVFLILSNPKYKWLSINNIVVNTGLNEKIVLNSLKILRDKDMIVKSSNCNSSGNTLYASKERYLNNKEFKWNRILSVLSDSVV